MPIRNQVPLIFTMYFLIPKANDTYTDRQTNFYL